MPFKCFEYNIPFARRFIFDYRLTPLHIISYEREGPVIKKILKVTPGEPELSALAFDIETYNPVGMPREKKDPAIMISYCGKKKGVLTWKESDREFVESLGSEKEMLERFSEIVRKEDPDILYGYNSGNFDIPYLMARAEATKADFSIWKGSSAPRKLTKGQVTGIRVPGRIHVDLYPLVRFLGIIGIIKAQRFTLDSIAKEVLGKRKIEIEKETMWKDWDSGNIDKLLDYSLVDSELAMELGERFIPIGMELSSLVRLPLFETVLSTSGQMVENLLMAEASGRGMLIPSKPGGDTIHERLNDPIQGAFVKLPEPGIYENMAVLDFRGLYPSIIISYNIDPDTLTGGDGDAHISPTGAKFIKSTKGLVPSVLEHLVDLRAQLKAQLRAMDKDSDEYVRMSARSHAIKIVSNSFYGYLGYARSRWYSRPCAESVTAWGRKHINETIKKAEESGFQVLYADTDSVFLIHKDRDSVIRFMDEVNASLPEKMELELEGFYPRGVFVSKKGGGERGAKKKYALIGEDGRIKIRGFELVRRDWSPIAKNTQKQVLEAILKDGSKEKAVKIVRDTIRRLQEGDVPIDELAISTQLNKDISKYEIVSPELSAAKKMLKRGLLIEQGSIISYVITQGGGSISERAEPADSAKNYDADYYLNNQLLPAVMKILKELGYDEYGLKIGGKQKSLDSFF
ncbi:MAG: DNA-directed DNA polymerase [Candidatus Micrarchaeota archaeon]